MSNGILLEDVCRVMAGLCLAAALAAAAAAVILLVREGLAGRLRDELKSKYRRRIGLLVLFTVCVWLLVIGQNASAAEAVPAAETGVETASAGETNAEMAAAGETDAEAAPAEEPGGEGQPQEPSEAQETSKTSEPSGQEDPSVPQDPTEPQDPPEPQDQPAPQDLQAPNVFIEMTDEVNEDEEGNVYCRADNAGVRIVIEENREEDTGTAVYRVVITDREGTEIRRDWQNAGETDPEQQEPQPQGRLGRITERIETEEIAALADGVITVRATAEDAAGNRRERAFSYILDTKGPELTQIHTFRLNDDEETRVDGGILYDGCDLYYRDEQLVTRFRIEDDNPVAWKISFMEQSEAEPDDHQDRDGGRIRGDDQEPGSYQDPADFPSPPNIARQKTGNGHEGSVRISKEGVYSDWSISGEDIAGNQLRAAADCECTQDAEELYEEAGEIRLPRRKILDRTAPVGEILYESTATGYLYEEASGPEVFWNADVKASMRVQDSCAGQEMPVDEEKYGFLVWNEEDGQPQAGESPGHGPGIAEEVRPQAGGSSGQDSGSVEAGWVLIGTYLLDRDGQVRFGAYGKDRAGNPLTVREAAGTAVIVKENEPAAGLSVNQNDLSIGTDLPGQGEPADCRPCAKIVRDTACPTLASGISLPAGNPDAADTRSGIIYYGRNTNYYSGGIPAINVSFTVSDRNIDERDLATLAAYENVPEGGSCEEIMPERMEEAAPDQVEKTVQDQAEPVTQEGGIGALPSADDEISLRFRLSRHPGSDDTPDGVYRFGIRGTDKAGNPLRLAESEEANETYGVLCADEESGLFLTGRKVVDTTAPSGSLRIENRAGTVYCRISEHAKAWTTERDAFMPYRREKEAVVGLSAEDTSPVSASCRIRSTSGGDNEVLTGEGRSAYSSPCRHKIRIRGEQVFRIEDVVFRDRAGNESSVLKRTVNFYLDTRLPNADIDAPSARIYAVPASTGRSGGRLPLYAGGVTLQVSAEDPYRNSGASGLHEVRYDVEIDGRTVRSAALFTGEEPSSDPDSEREPEFGYSGRIEIPSGGQWESGDIVVRVTAEDNAGNRSESGGGSTYRFAIDTKGPEVTVRYDNNEVRNGQYFDRERTARIIVRERNFDKGAIAVGAPGAQTGAWELLQTAENGKEDVWTTKVRFPADGIYTLDVTGTDAAGNPASVRYEGEAPRTFVVDGTPPLIEVTWDNTDVRNGRYYNRERLATVRITDLSFSEEFVRVLPESTGFRRVSDAEGISVRAGADTGSAGAGTGDVSPFGSVGAIGAGLKSRAAQVYEMELPFTKEGEWMLRCACTDLAGNTAAPIAEAPFVLDFTGPRLYFDKRTVQEGGAYAEKIEPELRWEEENPSSAACYSSWANVTAGGKIMECRSAAISAGAGRTVLPDLPNTIEADGICVLYGTACDLAGNRSFVRRNLTVNRFGSLYDLSEDEGTMQMIGNYYTEGVTPFVVAEYNISPLVQRRITLFSSSAARVLTENAEYTVEESSGRSGYKYVYRIAPSAFAQEGVYSLLLESDDEAGRHNSSPGRFIRRIGPKRSDEAAGPDYSPEWAIDRTPPAVRIAGVDTDRHRFVTDAVSFSLIPEDNMELGSLTIRIADDSGTILEEQILEKDELKEIMDTNCGEVPVEITASGKWQTISAEAVDGAGNRSSGIQGLGQGDANEDDASGAVNEETGYRVLVTSNLLVHLYRSGLLPAAAFLALIAVVRIGWSGKI